MEQDAVRFIGIDLAKRSMEVCILSEDERTIRQSYRTDTNGRLRLIKELQATDTVAMEACSFAFVLAREITSQIPCRVVVLNPGKLAIIYKSTRKTDKEDAYKLALLISRYKEEELPIVSVPSEREERMRSTVTLKQYFVKLRTSLLNRLHAVYVQAGLTYVKKSDLATAVSREKMCLKLSEDHQWAAKMIESELGITEAQIAMLDDRIEGLIAEHELSPYVMSIPGVGPGVAAAFLAFVGDGKRFSSPAQVANYVGLIPRIDCSGETNRYGRITKDGCRAIRGVILQATWSLLRCKEGGRLQAKFFLLCERKGRTKSAVAIARRIVGLMWILVSRREFYADASREGLRKKFRYYKLKEEGWASIA